MTTKAHQSSFISFLCHLAFWFGPLFATPLFITLTNREDVTLSAAWVATFTALACLACSIGSWKLAASAGPRIEWWVNRILLALAFGIAIQGNIVHDLFYYGAFNGESVDFRADPGSFYLEFWAYLLFFPLALWLFSRIQRLSLWLPALPILSFCLLLVPSLLTVQTDDSRVALKTEIDPSVFAFSSNSNLIHLLPDGFQGDVVREVLQENPDLAAKFEGFTIFNNHLGLYQGTAPALYTILTGEPFALEEGFIASEVTDTVQTRSYPKALAEAGYQLDYVPISTFICIEKANSCHPRPFNDLKARGYFRHHNEDRSYSARLIADLSLFRLVPRFLKEKIYDQGNWFLSDTTLDGSAPWPAPVLRDWVENFHVSDSQPVYKWYHFIGTHIPPHWDQECRPQRDLELTRENYKAQAYCVLGDIGKLLDRLKQADIYDQTAMVISGDHGHNIVPDDLTAPALNGGLFPGLLGSGRPALLVKQKNNRKPLQFSNLPTSLPDIAPTALALAGIEPGAPTVFEIEQMDERERYFTPFSIPDLYSGEAIPYVRYRVEGNTWEGDEWILTDIKAFRQAPAVYDPVNLTHAQGFMIGAVLARNEPDKDSAWIKGRQLAFLINIEDPDSAKSLQMSYHLADWMPDQAVSIQVNGAMSQESVKLQMGQDFWHETNLPLVNDQLLPGRNFISLHFDNTYASPKISDWRASILLQSIRIKRDEQSTDSGRAHE